MALILLVVLAVFLFFRWYWKPITIPTATRDHGSFPLPVDAQRRQHRPAYSDRKLHAQFGNMFTIAESFRTKFISPDRDLNKVHSNTPETLSSLTRGVGIFLNKIIDEEYIQNIDCLIGSLGRFISRAPAQEHTAACAVEETHRCALEWTTKVDVDLFASVSELTHKAAVRILLGDDFYQSSDELRTLLRAVEEEAGEPWASVLPDWLPHPAVRRLRWARERAADIFTERLMRRDAVAVAGGPIEADRQDYVTFLLNEDSTASLKHLFPAHYTILMLFSQNGVASTVFWVLISLLRHPDVMNAVKRNSRSAENDSSLLKACIKETERYYENMRSSSRLDGGGGGGGGCCPGPDSWMPGRWLNAENKLVSFDEVCGGGGGGGVASDAQVKPAQGDDKLSAIVVEQVLTTLLRCYDVSWASPEQPQTVDFEALDFDRAAPRMKARHTILVLRIEHD
ncbi:cytochrome p450 4f8 [Colletotrichum kahawae]|uniref:Cytochrome p450 4f8 n=1 Tax=Colletotrichum kahawae TaxID=34407 RepID=A0AAE0D3Z5_COLKA|nr:cytochrome p450 4f8 [Colletotrichum kahawae]